MDSDHFQLNRPTHTVGVEGFSTQTPIHEIVTLFRTVIGDVRAFQDVRDGASHRLEITFYDLDTATKALCMNGYVIGGSPLAVSALTVSPPAHRVHRLSLAQDDRRNLYVLGLPFALTKNEFSSLFSQYGTVSHCVILATVDNSSRRRGFVVMSTHQEAKKAMIALTRTSIKGHTIDVSWAVVQRSQGFLDGGDRAVLLDSRIALPCSSPKMNERACSSDGNDSTIYSADGSSQMTESLLPTPSLVVTNLPTVVFSQASDLESLFLPFGAIEKLETVHVACGILTALVQYSSATIAKEAKENLSGQLWGNHQIEARFVTSPSANSSVTSHPIEPEKSFSDQPLALSGTPLGSSTSYEQLHWTVDSSSEMLRSGPISVSQANNIRRRRVSLLGPHGHARQNSLPAIPFHDFNETMRNPVRQAYLLSDLLSSAYVSVDC
ncbi:hypothetical protein CVT24_001211 [Panaeolus cyanescens]|uniref:RRM domain-containing protein n=1 Tax=Panaeolus cyanescens TaxID=181874 RepID=A0A409VTS9_9AGAR|nr:hypothetical protein CVT24_001211 [Panaeolus cyanescens]